MTSWLRHRPNSFVLAGILIWIACLSSFAQQTSAPPAATPSAATPSAATPAPPPQLPGGRGRPGVPDRSAGADFSPKPPIVPLTPEQQAARFILPPGYRMELVLAEPEIVNPTAIAFDGNGRLYVNEMRSYMLDADGSRQLEPVSRISVHESTKGDGRFDRHSAFVDNLVLPRFVLPLDGRSILTMETHAQDMFKYTDVNGDGVAEQKELFYTGVGRRGNLEHQQSGFVWGLDNWIYSTYNAFRFRWTPGGILREPTGPNSGQWGLTQDDNGKMWFVDAGGERGPMNFQVPIVYGAFSVADQVEPGFEMTWPVPGIADVEGGMLRVRMPIAALNHFTATCGPDIFRGDRLPADMRGDLLFAEPVGRLIRRSKVVVTEGLTQLRNAYPNSEFILSSDPLFRPVNMATAPDGTLYIVDMYHGIIQESEWTPQGSYLRKKIEQFQLDKITSHGRIWRLVYGGLEPDRRQPRMLDERPAQLVAHLEHPNGWWRDTAQRLLVLRQDKSVVPALLEMTRNSSSVLGRFHAMWTLEGLGALDAKLARDLLRDLNPLVRVQAIRASESLYKAGDQSFDADIRQLARDPDARVAMQAMLTLNLWKVPDISTVVEAVQSANKARGVQEVGRRILRPAATAFGGGGGMSVEDLSLLRQGEGIYEELCVTCHGPDGKGAPVALAPAGTLKAPSLAGSPRVQAHRDYSIKSVMHGLTGAIDGTTYTDVMVPMGSNDDAWMAAITSYVRNSFGNIGSIVTAADVARVRAAAGNRKTPWTVDEIEASLPVFLAPQPAWKATASHNPAVAANALGTGTWTTGEPQQAGMWFQIELPAAAPIAEIQFQSPPGPGGRGAGAGVPPGQGRGRGTTPAAPFAYSIQVSMDGSTWSAPVAEGQGSGRRTVIPFKPVEAKFVRITQTATAASPLPWALQRLRLYQLPGRTQ